MVAGAGSGVVGAGGWRWSARRHRGRQRGRMAVGVRPPALAGACGARRVARLRGGPRLRPGRASRPRPVRRPGRHRRGGGRGVGLHRGCRLDGRSYPVRLDLACRWAATDHRLPRRCGTDDAGASRLDRPALNSFPQALWKVAAAPYLRTSRHRCRVVDCSPQSGKAARRTLWCRDLVPATAIAPGVGRLQDSGTRQPPCNTLSSPSSA